MGACILDIDNPSIVKYRAGSYVLTPEEWYEERGFVPNVVFPCATLNDAATGGLPLLRCRDSYVAPAFTTVDEIVDFIKEHNALTDDDRRLNIAHHEQLPAESACIRPGSFFISLPFLKLLSVISLYIIY